MTSPTHGFSGERLRQAREARGLTATAVAAAVGVKPAAVSQYESAKISPRPDIAMELARILNVPHHFLTRPETRMEGSPVFYRSLSSATKATRVRMERQLQWAHEFLLRFLADYVEFPPLRLPKMAVPRDPNELTDDEIERFAMEARSLHGLRSGPVTNMTWLMERQGVMVVCRTMPTDKLDSFSQWLDGCPWVFLNAEKGSAVRYNFDLAHELGHLLLHAHLDVGRVFKSPEHKVLEDQANRFAGAFLLPADGFARDVFAPTLGAFRSLKPKWRTSIGVMINRTKQLGMLSEKEESWLWMQYGRRGWRRWEPLDDDIEAVFPHLLGDSIKLLLDNRLLTRADLLAHVPMDGYDIEATAGLPPGFLSEPDAIPVRLKVGRSVDEPSHDPSRIIAFPKGAPWAPR